MLTDRAIVMPVNTRVAKVTHSIDIALATNLLTPPAAAELGGTTGFLSTTTFGRVGRAAAKPIYARQHNHKTGNQNTTTD